MSVDPCAPVREALVPLLREQLDDAHKRRVEAHLATCSDCSRSLEAERALDDAFLRALPKEPAPEGLRERVARMRSGAPELPKPADVPPTPYDRATENAPRRVATANRRLGRIVASAAIFAAAACALVYAGYRIPHPHTDGEEPLVAEAVNDHLRVLYAPALDVKSGGVHQVKPWFDGKLDFAPVLAFGGDDDFPLEGGSLGVFIDRKAAVFAFRRRLHPINLFVFRADGLAFPKANGPSLGASPSTHMTARGFHVILWQANGLGYALVSDLDEKELGDLAGRIAGATP